MQHAITSMTNLILAGLWSQLHNPNNIIRMEKCDLELLIYNKIILMLVSKWRLSTGNP